MRHNKSTEHAQRRKQQRGISDLKEQLILTFGEDHYQKGGSYLCVIPDRKLAELRKAIDQLQGIALVKGENDRVITAMHQDKRVHKTAYAA